jgi:hypothetical protein
MTTNPRPQLRRGFHEPVDYGAVYTSNAEPHGVDLPPALPGQKCAACEGAFTSESGRIVGRIFNGQIVCVPCAKELSEDTE